MDALTEEGIVALGGPAGEGDAPWADERLTIDSVAPWSVWLRAARDQSSLRTVEIQ